MIKSLQMSLTMVLVTAVLIYGGTFGCGSGTTSAASGGDDSSGDSSGGDSSGGTSSSTVDNAFASAYPTGLVVTSLATTSSTGSALRAGLTIKNASEISEEEEVVEDYETAVQEQVDLLNGETAEDCQINAVFKQNLLTRCFGNGFLITKNGVSQEGVLH